MHFLNELLIHIFNIIFILAPLAGRLSDLYGSRIMGLVGGVLAAIGMATTGVAQTLVTAIFTYGGIVGRVLITNHVINNNYNKNRKILTRRLKGTLDTYGEICMSQYSIEM